MCVQSVSIWTFPQWSSKSLKPELAKSSKGFTSLEQKRTIDARFDRIHLRWNLGPLIFCCSISPWILKSILFMFLLLCSGWEGSDWIQRTLLVSFKFLVPVSFNETLKLCVLKDFVINLSIEHFCRGILWVNRLYRVASCDRQLRTF